MLDGYAGAWIDARRRVCEDGRLATASIAVLNHRLECLAEARRSLVATTEALVQADSDVVEHALRLAAALPSVQRCDTVENALGAPPPEAAAVRQDLARVRSKSVTGKYADAEELGEFVLARAEAIDYPPVVVEALTARVSTANRLGHRGQAEALGKRALSLALQTGQSEEAARAAIDLVATIGRTDPRHDEGLAFVTVAEGLIQRVGRDDLSADLHVRIAQVHIAAAEYDEAIVRLHAATKIYERMVGEPRTAWVKGLLARAHESRGDTEAAREAAQAALALNEHLYGTDHPVVAQARAGLGITEMRLGRYEAALAHFEAALQVHLRTVGEGHHDVGQSYLQIGSVHLQLRRFSKAVPILRKALAILLVADESSVNSAQARAIMALALFKAGGDRDEAEAEMRRAIADKASALGPTHPDVAMSRSQLSSIVEGRGAVLEAVAIEEQAIADLSERVPSDHPTMAAMRVHAARMLLDAGEPVRGRTLLEDALVVLRESGAHDHRARCAMLLAELLWGDPSTRARARALAETAREAYGRAGPGFAGAARDADNWLQAHPKP